MLKLSISPAFLKKIIPLQSLFAILIESGVIILFSFSSSPTIATEVGENWYQIEYVIFEHLDSDRHVLRFEDISYSLPKRAQYLHLLNSKNLLSPNQITQLPLDQMDLKEAIKHLQQSKTVKVYNYGAWQNALSKGQKLLPLKIDQDMTDNGGQHLTGEITIRRGRYMHAEVNLFLSDFIALPYKDLKEWLFQDDKTRWPLSWLLQQLSYQHPLLEKMGQYLLPENLIHLHQSRRIKEGEVHYIDHPALGVIISIKQIDPPFEYANGAAGTSH